jgi:hypothetical protein
MITFDAPAGTRILRSRFFGITNFDGLWWSYDQRKWAEHVVGEGSTHAPCRSYKAFLRHIRKHPELTSAILVSRFVGHDIHYNKDQSK